MAVDKATALDAIKQFANEAGLTTDEVMKAVGGVPAQAPVVPPAPAHSEPAAPLHQHNLSINEVLAYVGALIVVIGLSVLIGQNWVYMGTAVRLLLTLGVGAAFYGTGTYLMAQNQYERLANAFHVIAAYGLSVGIAVLIYSLGVIDDRWAWVMGAASLTALYAVSDVTLRRIVLSFFMVVFATALFWAIFFASGVMQAIDSVQPVLYAWMAVGVSYITLVYAWNGTRRMPLANTLATLGTLFALGGAYGLTFGDGPSEVMWILLFPGALAAALYGSVKLRSGGMFAFTVLWMVAYIFMVTGRYFAQTIGWPVALMFAGLILIATGYFAVGFKNKYLNAK